MKDGLSRACRARNTSSLSLFVGVFSDNSVLHHIDKKHFGLHPSRLKSSQLSPRALYCIKLKTNQFTMGLFGPNKKGTDSVRNDAYEDIENIPMAIAVTQDDNYNKQIVAASKQGASPKNKLQIINDSRRGGHGRAVSPMRLPASIVFMSRTPTVVPQCPVCMKANIRTRTTTAPDWMTWVTVAVILVTFWPLCWIPLVTDSCRRTIHYCTSCHGEVGSIRPYKDCCVKHR